MRYKFTPAKNPRVLIIQKVYGQLINNDHGGGVEYPRP